MGKLEEVKMKTRLIIEVETRDITDDMLPVIEEAIGMDDADITEDMKKDINDYQKDWVKAIHEDVVSEIERYIKDEFEEQFLDNLEEESVDGWDDFADYGIGVTIHRDDAR
jgi:hypothetical protein